MATSYNGWPVNRTPSLDNTAIPGTNVKFAPGMLAGDVATVLSFVGFWLNRNIEPAVSPGCWGFAYRENRNAANWSCHASATAVDYNAPKHPNGKRGTWGSAASRIRSELLGYLEGVVQWGEDYTGTPDGMHFEIIRPAGEVAPVAAKIVRDHGPREQWASGVAPAPAAPSGFREIALGEPTELGTCGEQVRKDQFDLNDSGFTLSVDGFAGPATKTRIIDFQYAAGLTMDGVMGPQTRDAIHKVPSWNNGQPIGGGYSALRWQQELKEHGWAIETDGAWGPHSDSILRQFQADKHIDVNGQRNYQTWSALHTQPN